MEQSDARPPPGVCDRIAQVLRDHPDVTDLVEFREKYPFDFALLHYHAAKCESCRLAINQAFPDGYATPEEAQSLDEGLRKAEQLLARDQAERDSSRNPPETERPGSEPRGDG